MDYFVLKGHDLREPISERRLFAAVERGELTSEDLVRPTNGFLWVPLRRLVPSKTPVPQILVGQAQTQAAGEVYDDPPEDKAQGGGTSAIWGNPVPLGIVCLIFACLVLLLSRWPFVLYVPLLLATIVAGGLAMSRARVRAGAFLCAGAILIPTALWWLSSVVENRTAHNEAPPIVAADEQPPEAIVQPRIVPSTPLPIVQATPIGEPDEEKAPASTPEASPSPAASVSTPSAAPPPIPLPEPAAKSSTPERDARVIPESTPAPLRRRDPVALPQPVRPPGNAAAILRSTQGGPSGTIPSDPDGLRAK